jgi:hypothetical protein
MGRAKKKLDISVSPEIAAVYEQMAARRRKSKSELFREMVEAYRAQIEENEFFRLQRRMLQRISRKKPFTEKEVEKIVFQDR